MPVQLQQSKVYSNQVNAESRKGQLKNGSKACGVFLLVLAPSPPSSEAVLKAVVAHIVSICPWFWREQSRSYWKIIVYVCFNLLGSHLKD